LEAYRRLNAAKFEVVHEIEAKLGVSVFKREQEIYRARGRRRLSRVEAAVPWSFAGLYLLLMLAAAVAHWGR
jgi:hypothetical protein